MRNRGQIVFDALLNAFLIVAIISILFYAIFLMENTLVKKSIELDKKILTINVLNYLTEKKLIKNGTLDTEKIRIVSDLGVLDLKREMGITNSSISIRISGERSYETREKCRGWCASRGAMIGDGFGFVEVCAC